MALRKWNHINYIFTNTSLYFLTLFLFLSHKWRLQWHVTWVVCVDETSTTTGRDHLNSATRSFVNMLLIHTYVSLSLTLCVCTRAFNWKNQRRFNWHSGANKFGHQFHIVLFDESTISSNVYSSISSKFYEALAVIGWWWKSRCRPHVHWTRWKQWLNNTSHTSLAKVQQTFGCHWSKWRSHTSNTTNSHVIMLLLFLLLPPPLSLLSYTQIMDRSIWLNNVKIYTHRTFSRTHTHALTHANSWNMSTHIVAAASSPKISTHTHTKKRRSVKVLNRPNVMEWVTISE